MAYANTVTVTRKNREVVVTITETECAAGSEADPIDLGFSRGRILRQACVKTAGSAATVDPIIGTATNPSGASVVLENDTAAATVDNQITGGATFNGSVLYHRSNPASATDNSITTTYHILVGWGQ